MAGVKGRSGGARANSGPARTPGSVRWQKEQRKLAMGGGQNVSQVGIIKAPSGIPVAVLGVWDELAPHAGEAGTLVARHVPGFLRLCMTVAAFDKLAKDVIEQGFQDARQLDQFLKFEREVRIGLRDYMLNAFGRPVVQAKTDANPFERFEKR